MAALEYAPNGITIRATQPKEFYVGNQWHELNGTQYYVPLTKIGLLSFEDKEHCVTTFITDMSHVFKNYCSYNPQITSWDTSNVITMYKMFSGASSFN